MQRIMVTVRRTLASFGVARSSLAVAGVLGLAAVATVGAQMAPGQPARHITAASTIRSAPPIVATQPAPTVAPTATTPPRATHVPIAKPVIKPKVIVAAPKVVARPKAAPRPAPKPAPRPILPPQPVGNPGTQGVINLIKATFGAYSGGALRVAACESGYNPYAVNRSSGATGIFQFLLSTWRGTPYASYSRTNAWANIHAAYWVFVKDGHSWREWSCKP